jgi:hypothetical protein
MTKITYSVTPDLMLAINLGGSQTKAIGSVS